MDAHLADYERMVEKMGYMQGNMTAMDERLVAAEGSAAGNSMGLDISWLIICGTVHSLTSTVLLARVPCPNQSEALAVLSSLPARLPASHLAGLLGQVFVSPIVGPNKISDPRLTRFHAHSGTRVQEPSFSSCRRASPC